MLHCALTFSENEMKIKYTIGYQTRDAKLVSILYNESFGQKFRLAIRNHEKRREVVHHLLNPRFCIAAYSGTHLLGVAGFQNAYGTLVKKASFRVLYQVLGFWSGLWAAFILLFYHRHIQYGELLLDGIANDPQCRGQGVGRGLLQEVLRYARDNNYDRVLVDVPDMTEKAKGLYLKHNFTIEPERGFVVWFKKQFRYLKSTRLVFDLKNSINSEKIINHFKD